MPKPSSLSSAATSSNSNVKTTVSNNLPAKAPSSIFSTPEFIEKLGAVLTSANPRTPHEVICALIHLLMSKSGYIDSTTKETSLSLPAEWKRNSLYLLNYLHPIKMENSVTIKCAPMQNFLMIHASIKDSPGTLSMKVNVTDFIRIDRPISSDPSMFQKIDVFSKEYKDEISNRLTAKVYELAGLLNAFGLIALTTEIKLMILGYLDAKTLVRVGTVNREFKVLSKDPFLWRSLVVRDFGLPKGALQSEDWYSLYKRHYQEYSSFEKRRRIEQDRAVPFYPSPYPLFDPNPYYPTPVSGGFPGIFGGDYDRLPPNPFPGGGFGGMPRYPGPNPMPGGMGPPSARFDPFGPNPGINNAYGRGRGRGRGDPFGGIF